MFKYLKFLSPLALLLSIFLILNFKAMPDGKLWNDYSILYVPAETDDSIVVYALEKSNITDYIALSNQYLPINLSSTSVEYSMFRIYATNNGDEYHQRRNRYFFDKSNQYRLYYIPSNERNYLTTTVSILNSQKITCGIDSTSTYPWILPVIAVLLSIMLTLFSKKKLLFVLSFIPVIIFLYANPFYPVALSLSLILLILFFVSNTWKRQGFILRLINSYSVPAMLFISCLCAFSTGIKCGLLFFVLCLAILSVYFIYNSAEEFLRNKKSFIPVFIKPAKMINIFARKTNLVMSIVILGSLIFIGTYFLTGNESVNSHFVKILLPSNSEYQDEELPQLEEYYQWTWDIKTAPYRSLNREGREDLVEYPKYTEDSNGLLRESKIIMSYNQNFRDNTFDDIDNLSFNAIEKVIKSEGQKFNGGYRASSDYHNSTFGIIMMLICVFILLFLYISIIMSRGNKK